MALIPKVEPKAINEGSFRRLDEEAHTMLQGRPGSELRQPLVERGVTSKGHIAVAQSAAVNEQE